jgi:hypothetical protein
MGWSSANVGVETFQILNSHRRFRTPTSQLNSVTSVIGQPRAEEEEEVGANLDRSAGGFRIVHRL